MSVYREPSSFRVGYSYSELPSEIWDHVVSRLYYHPAAIYNLCRTDKWFRSKFPSYRYHYHSLAVRNVTQQFLLKMTHYDTTSRFLWLLDNLCDLGCVVTSPVILSRFLAPGERYKDHHVSVHVPLRLTAILDPSKLYVAYEYLRCVCRNNGISYSGVVDWIRRYPGGYSKFFSDNLAGDVPNLGSWNPGDHPLLYLVSMMMYRNEDVRHKHLDNYKQLDTFREIVHALQSENSDEAFPTECKLQRDLRHVGMIYEADSLSRHHVYAARHVYRTRLNFNYVSEASNGFVVSVCVNFYMGYTNVESAGTVLRELPTDPVSMRFRTLFIMALSSEFDYHMVCYYDGSVHVSPSVAMRLAEKLYSWAAYYPAKVKRFDFKRFSETLNYSPYRRRPNAIYPWCGSRHFANATAELDYYLPASS